MKTKKEIRKQFEKKFYQTAAIAAKAVLKMGHGDFSERKDWVEAYKEFERWVFDNINKQNEVAKPKK